MSVEVCVCPRTKGIFFIFILPLEYLILFHSILEENSFLILLSLWSQEIYFLLRLSENYDSDQILSYLLFYIWKVNHILF